MQSKKIVLNPQMTLISACNIQIGLTGMKEGSGVFRS